MSKKHTVFNCTLYNLWTIFLKTLIVTGLTKTIYYLMLNCPTYCCLSSCYLHIHTIWLKWLKYKSDYREVDCCSFACCIISSLRILFSVQLLPTLYTLQPNALFQFYKPFLAPTTNLFQTIVAGRIFTLSHLSFHWGG